MIWFSCKQCGKKHHRSDTQAGTMIFCDCGQGLRVPWASTIAEPEVPDEPEPIPARPVPPAQPVPPARAVPVDDSNDVPHRPSVPLPPSPPSSMPVRRPRTYRKVNPDYCFNHDESAKTHHCSDCRLPFCDSCVVSFKGQMLCGPCKNFRLRALNRPPRVSVLAVVAVIVGLAAGPIALCLGSATMNPQLNPQGSTILAVVLSLVGMIIPAGAITLGGFALREIESKPNVGGRGMAMTGLFMGLAGVLWNLAVCTLVIVQQVTG